MSDSPADDDPDGAGGVVAAGVGAAPAHAGGAPARAHALAPRRRRARAAHAVRAPRAPLRALGVRVRAPGGLRPPHHLRQDHAPHPARGRRAVRAGGAAGQVPPARRHAAALALRLAALPLRLAALAALAARAAPGPGLGRLMSERLEARAMFVNSKVLQTNRNLY